MKVILKEENTFSMDWELLASAARNGCLGYAVCFLGETNQKWLLIALLLRPDYMDMHDFQKVFKLDRNTELWEQV